MATKDYKDLLGGGLLLGIGGFASLTTIADLPIGSFARMGPGMFPILAGGGVAALGLGIAIGGWRRAGLPLNVDWRSITCILGAILAFSLLIERCGLVPTVVLSSIIASYASPALSFGKKLALAAAIAVISSVIFGLGFQLQVPFFDLPWSLE